MRDHSVDASAIDNFYTNYLGIAVAADSSTDVEVDVRNG